jgi:hypothetical protein
MKIPYFPEILIALGLAVGIYGLTGVTARDYVTRDAGRLPTAVGAGMVVMGFFLRDKTRR